MTPRWAHGASSYMQTRVFASRHPTVVQSSVHAWQPWKVWCFVNSQTSHPVCSGARWEPWCQALINVQMQIFAHPCGGGWHSSSPQFGDIQTFPLPRFPSSLGAIWKHLYSLRQFLNLLLAFARPAKVWLYRSKSTWDQSKDLTAAVSRLLSHPSGSFKSCCKQRLRAAVWQPY